jgi:hypothetical protein
MKQIMRSLIIGLALACAVPIYSLAQNYFYNDRYYDKDVLVEAGVSFGGMNCLTDIGGKSGLGKKFVKDLVMKNTCLYGGFYVDVMYQDKIGVRLETTIGSVKAKDSDLKQYVSNAEAKKRYDRNLSFKSSIAEVSLCAEIYPIELFTPFVSDYVPNFSPYLIAGVGFFGFNPKTNLNGQWIELQPLRLEGQGFAEYPDRPIYKRFQMNIPYGFGIKYEASPRLNFRFEMVHRVLQTDYLDDVSTSYINPNLFDIYLNPAEAALAKQLYYRGAEIGGPAKPLFSIRGNPKDHDYYFTFGFKIGYVFGRQSRY